MEILYFDQMNDQEINNQIKEILFDCDQEFVPTLSSRSKSTQMNFKSNEENISSDGPIQYFNQMIKQRFLIAKENEQVLGFMTFIYDYKNEIYDEFVDGYVNSYITTICVRKEHRGNKICQKFYDKIETLTLDNQTEKYISTRTWSQNKVHLKTLDNRGYARVKIIHNDRGTGIDTIYFLKKV